MLIRKNKKRKVNKLFDDVEIKGSSQPDTKKESTKKREYGTDMLYCIQHPEETYHFLLTFTSTVNLNSFCSFVDRFIQHEYLGKQICIAFINLEKCGIKLIVKGVDESNPDENNETIRFLRHKFFSVLKSFIDAGYGCGSYEHSTYCKNDELYLLKCLKTIHVGNPTDHYILLDGVKRHIDESEAIDYYTSVTKFLYNLDNNYCNPKFYREFYITFNHAINVDTFLECITEDARQLGLLDYCKPIRTNGSTVRYALFNIPNNHKDLVKRMEAFSDGLCTHVDIEEGWIVAVDIRKGNTDKKEDSCCNSRCDSSCCKSKEIESKIHVTIKDLFGHKTGLHVKCNNSDTKDVLVDAILKTIKQFSNARVTSCTKE